MRSLIAFSWVLAAVPAAAQTDMPPPPLGSSYIEAACAGGYGGRSETVRIMADGRVMRLPGRGATLQTGRVAPGRYTALSRRLDRAGFDRRTTPRPPGRVYGGTFCMLTRVLHGVPHELDLPQAVRMMPQMRDVAEINNDVLVLGQQAAAPRLRPATNG